MLIPWPVDPAPVRVMASEKGQRRFKRAKSNSRCGRAIGTDDEFMMTDNVPRSVIILLVTLSRMPANALGCKEHCCYPLPQV